MTIKIHLKLPVTSDQIMAIDVLDKAFATEGLSISRQKIKQLMQKGCVWLEGAQYTQRLRRAKKLLKKGEVLHCYYDESVLAVEPQAASLISDEGEYSIWNKPFGMLSQGSKWGDHCTIHRWVEKHLKPERPAFIVHRLDRAASGIIIIAHTKKIAAKFSQMFKERKIEKHYAVSVLGNFSDFEGFHSEITTIQHAQEDKLAVSHVHFLEYHERKNQSLLDVAIETGRKHQIRKHLSIIGYPVVGDRLYGDKTTNDQDLQLIAISLKFICPVTEIEKSYRI